jgi:hypothetical protein
MARTSVARQSADRFPCPPIPHAGLLVACTYSYCFGSLGRKRE